MRDGFLGLKLVSLASLLFATACGSLPDDCHQTLTCHGAGGASGSSGTGGQSGAGGEAPGCDPSAHNGPVDGSCGVFVSSSKGNDKNRGSQSAPVKTIAHAIAIAKEKPVYLCGEQFDERVEISSKALVFGALDCAHGWAYIAGSPTRVAPSSTGPALVIANASEAVDLEDIVFTAKPGSKPGESSIGAFVHDSTNVSLRRVEIEAGAGVAGENGTLAMHSFPMQSDLNGNSASGTSGGMAMICACPGGAQTSGGIGGAATPGGQAGGQGQPDNGGGQPGVPGSCSPNGTGHDGNVGVTASHAAGASTLGQLASSGWTPSSGKDAGDGGPGQGGGGGASNATGGGGSGGCGGCGGAGAKGAKGGGASVALLILNAAVSVKSSKLVAKDAGDGGKGVAGQPGQTIFGFLGNGTNGACTGGNGGVGGDGGASGGGAGGVSASVFYSGAKPTLSGTSSVHGVAGKKGTGGDPGHNDGVAGKSGDMLAAP